MTTRPGPIKVGLIGLGNMGRNHLRVLSMLKDVDLRFICDSDEARAAELSRQYGVRATANLEADLPGVDALVIVTPTSTHYDYIKLASRYVKEIFVEKPLTDTLESSAEILALAREHGVRIQVGFIERFNPAVMAVKKVLSNSSQVINIDFTRTNKVSSRITDVDVVTDLMIHDIDLALYLNGAARQVSAYGVLEGGMIAFARATLTHANGAYSNITASRITEKRLRHISVTCSDMYVDCNLLRKEVMINKQSIEQYYEKVSISSKEETIDVRPEEALLSELMAFVQSVGNPGAEGIPSALDGYQAMEIARQVQQQVRGA
ncbi:Gfo/Idh/MocA family oxidoreductase [Geomonas azotofigens]|uniref:Gfo/Idh/MocA family oxidoreductase n=1 Tax=Geomonas azotofigens TaxID=2843196 RepID=UPI001C12347D|nr:Gfo/Idh/MocA family oxidoreductase [Geomonas azotofigens]MBU5613371.1 Gfo/Idh/MocA family oxidoreductase [Geomonas azotofigens]